ncbi:MAG TPA: rhodanese-like domain-containing protein [Rhodocyclaceae bacterium]|nr:rhodanese-like domain-containing protein [Rhodocyclaceae bacterium]
MANEDFLKLANAARSRITEIDADAALQKQTQGAVVIDVRDAEELVDTPGLPGSVNISRGRLETKIADVVPDKDAPVVLYCGAGNRGALAADSLRQMGYTNVCNVTGGINAFKK